MLSHRLRVLTIISILIGLVMLTYVKYNLLTNWNLYVVLLLRHRWALSLRLALLKASWALAARRQLLIMFLWPTFFIHCFLATLYGIFCEKNIE